MRAAYYSYRVFAANRVFLANFLLVLRNKTLAPVVSRVDSAIDWINHYPLDNSIGFASVYLLDSDLSGG